MQGLEGHSVQDTNNREDKYEFVLGMKALASKGMATEVVEEVNAMDASFFVQNPILLFQLKQVCGFCIVSCFIFNTLNKNCFHFVYEYTELFSFHMILY